MNERINIKMVKDASRTVIVIEGPSEERDLVAYHLVQNYLGFDTKDEVSPIPKVEGIAPPPKSGDMPSQEEINTMTDIRKLNRRGVIISSGPYAGKTAVEALALDKSSALGKLFTYARNLPNDSLERSEISKTCKQWMYNAPSLENEYTTRSSKLAFINDARAIGSLETYFNGYKDFESFSQYASDEEVNVTFGFILKHLQDRSMHG